jgi:small subunit ribosomal protein S18
MTDRQRSAGGGGNRRRFMSRRKVCMFCSDKIRLPDYKDLKRIQRCVSERGKILPRRRTGTCARHQRSLTVAIKRARHMALLPFVSSNTRG